MEKVKRLMKDEKIKETIINKMFEIAGHTVTYNDVKYRDDEWYLEWGMDDNQRNEWIEWASEYLQKERKISKSRARISILYFNLRSGLTDIK